MKCLCVLNIILCHICFQNLVNAVESQIPDDLYLTEDEETMLSTGFEVDYTFNETLTEADDPGMLISVPGCPASADNPEKGTTDSHSFIRNFWVQYGSPPKCYLVGTQGPCPSEMYIGPRANSVIGLCKKWCWFEADRGNKPFLENESYLWRSKFGIRIMMDDQCFTEFLQGPCAKGEILILNKSNNSFVCETRKATEQERWITFGGPPTTIAPSGIDLHTSCGRSGQKYSKRRNVCVPLNRISRNRSV